MRLRRGQWAPLIPERWRTAVLSVIPLTPVVIGSDYLLGEDGSSLSEVERAAPMWAWGIALVVSGLTIAAGYAGRWRHVAIVGLHLTGALMVTLGIGIGTETVDVLGGFRWPWMYCAIGLAAWGAAIGYALQIETPTEEAPSGPE
ncbi:MAG: hypothetical protein QM658_09690 [Gordonia sp. (in: high G+C Gram-positive bacteria)]